MKKGVLSHFPLSLLSLIDIEVGTKRGKMVSCKGNWVYSQGAVSYVDQGKGETLFLGERLVK